MAMKSTTGAVAADGLSSLGEDRTVQAGLLSELVARKARAVEATQQTLVLLREFRSLKDSVADANGKIQEALRAREKVKVTSARLKEQRKVVDELSAIVDKTAKRMYERDSEEVRLSLVTAGEAKLVAERLAARLARKVLRLRDKEASYSITVKCRDEILKAWEQRLPQAMEAEKIINATLRDYLAVFKRGMKSFPESERAILGIVQKPSSTSRDETRGAPPVSLVFVADDAENDFKSNKKGHANYGASEMSPLLTGSSSNGPSSNGPPSDAPFPSPEKIPAVPFWSDKDDPYLTEIEAPHSEVMDVEHGFRDKNSQQKSLGLHKSTEAVDKIAAADAEEVVARGLLESLRAEVQAWKSSIAEARTSEGFQKLKRTREELDNAEGDAEFAVFQVKEGEKDLAKAEAELADAREMADKQTRILHEANEDLRLAMSVESAARTLRARMQREEAELVKAQAERVAGAMSRKVKRAEALVLERRQELQVAMVEREKAARKVPGLKTRVKELQERNGKGELEAKEAIRLMKLLKPVVIAKHGEALTARGRL
ncbi:unnamed protein product [Closterium sp. Yama58-4]|nr:unnamed protein product [Closterium sp. Yama58-4]